MEYVEMVMMFFFWCLGPEMAAGCQTKDSNPPKAQAHPGRAASMWGED